MTAPPAEVLMSLEIIDAGKPTGPATPAGPAAPGRPVGPITGGSSAPGATTPSDRSKPDSTAKDRQRLACWQYWWEMNQDAFLDQARSRVVVVTAAGAASSAAPLAPGRAFAPALTRDSVSTSLVPALRKAVEDDDPFLVGSAALALGRIVEREDEGLVRGHLVWTVGRCNTSVREQAVLALGALGSSSAIPPLSSLLDDDAEGCRIAADPLGVRESVRALAALSLGMIDSPESVNALVKTLRNERRGGGAELQSALVTALGIARVERERSVPLLASLLDERSLAPIARAQIPIALGRLVRAENGDKAAGSGGVATLLLARLESGKGDDDLRRSLAIALGMVGRLADDEVVAALIEAVRTDRDSGVRHFAMMSLAGIAARDEEPAVHRSEHARVQSLLLEELRKPSGNENRPFAALALALQARGDSIDPALRSRAEAQLQRAFKSSHVPHEDGALALALGLLRAEAAIEEVAARFGASHDLTTKGYLAVALGLLDARKKTKLVHAELSQPGRPPFYRMEITRTLELLGDPGLATALLADLRKADTPLELAPAAYSIAALHETRGVDELLRIVDSNGQASLARGAAAAALGILVEKRDSTWNTRFKRDANYMSCTASLARVLNLP